jgi:hypothetical protein
MQKVRGKSDEEGNEISRKIRYGFLSIGNSLALELCAGDGEQKRSGHGYTIEVL